MSRFKLNNINEYYNAGIKYGMIKNDEMCIEVVLIGKKYNLSR